MAEQIIIPPKSEWAKLSITQLYEVKDNLTTRYYDMLRVNASFAPQFLKFVSEVAVLIQVKENEPAPEEDPS